MEDPDQRSLREPWEYDEFLQIGADFNTPEEVRIYDERMAAIRDIDGENSTVIRELDLKDDDVLLEIGCGTGEFSLAAARHCKQVLATDVSRLMLEATAQKAADRKITNIEIRHAGFLSLKLGTHEVDAIVTSLALHHLPDFWKMAALINIKQWLKPGGVFFLRDVIFSFPMEKAYEQFRKWRAASGDEGTRASITNHIRSEFSTYAWILEGMLERAGLAPKKMHYSEDGFIAEYICIKS